MIEFLPLAKKLLDFLTSYLSNKKNKYSGKSKSKSDPKRLKKKSNGYSIKLDLFTAQIGSEFIADKVYILCHSYITRMVYNIHEHSPRMLPLPAESKEYADFEKKDMWITDIMHEEHKLILHTMDECENETYRGWLEHMGVKSAYTLHLQGNGLSLGFIAIYYLKQNGMTKAGINSMISRLPHIGNILYSEMKEKNLV